MLGELFRRMRYWVQRDQISRELEEEMRLHVEFRAERLRNAERLTPVPGLAPSALLGAASDDATYAAARRRFGNTITLQQRSRDMWGFTRLDDLTQDVRFAFRRLAQRPAFTAGVVGVMAVGIGATTAMFSAVDAALLRPLPFHKPEQLVVLPDIDVPFDDGVQSAPARPEPPSVVDVAAMPETFTSVAAYASGGLNLADPDNPARLKAGVVTTSFFNTLGVAPYRGRTFSAGEGRPGAPDVVVLSHGLWQRQYGGRDIRGLRISLSSRSYEVIGIMPPGFGFPKESDIWIPMSVPTTFETFRAFRSFLASTTIARLADSVNARTASARLLVLLTRHRTTLDTTMRSYYDKRLDVARAKGAARPLQRELVGDRRSAFLVLLGATVLLLLVACVNVMNLLLSHAAVRRRELAVRQVLGATRGRIIRQLLTENVILSVGGALVGILVAPLALSTMRALMPASLAGVAPAGVDTRVLGFATLLAVASGILFGLWPAIGSTRQSDADIIKSGSGHGATAANAGRARRLLVAAELALTVMLLIGAGLMLRSFQQLMSRDSGMRTSQVATLEMAVSRGANGATLLRNVQTILARLEATPGVQAAGMVNDLPLNGAGGIGLNITVDGAPQPPGEMRFARYLQASGGYFKTMGIPLLRGRVFTASDDSLAPKRAVISNTMAKAYWPDTDPVGRTFHFGPDTTPIFVIGVVADVRERKLEDDPGMQMYLSAYAQMPSGMAVVVRGTLPERALLGRLQDAVRSVDRSQAVFNVRMMHDVVSTSVAPRRTNTVLIAAFAALALLLASVGVYAVVSYGVSQRGREFGIRSALGATGSNLLRLVSGEMVWTSLAGIAAGLAGAWALSKTLASLVYGVDVHDPLTFALVPLVLVAPVVLATLVPAWRATRVNPAQVMRAD